MSINLRDSLIVLVLGCCVATSGSVQADERRPEPLVEKVRRAIVGGVRFLKEQEDGRSAWEAGSPLTGGQTSLAVLALLNAGVKPDDEVITRGLTYLRGLVPHDTYVVGLQTMVFADAGFEQDKKLIQRNVDWLVNSRVFLNRSFVGWGYHENGLMSDNSNTQYAVLGLFAGQKAGANIHAQVWQDV